MRLHVMWVPGADLARDNIVNRLRGQADVCVHADPDRRGLMQNWLGVLRCAVEKDIDQPWTVILQDDAAPLKGWQESLELATQNSPEPILGLTHFGGYGTKGVKAGAAYCVGNGLIWGGASAVRGDHREGLLEFAEFHDARGYPHDDRLMGAYAILVGHRTALTSQAVFGQPVKKSLIGHNTAVRSPATTIEDGIDLDWSKSVTLNYASNVVDELRRLALEFQGKFDEVGKSLAELEYPVRSGEVWRVGDHVYLCSDLMDSDAFEELLREYPPAVVYCDPPWGQGLANTFRTKASLERATYDWKDIYLKVATLGHSYGAPVWVEGSEISREFGAPVPSLIGLPNGKTQRGYWTISYMGGNPAGLFYAGSEPAPALDASKLVGFKGVREVLRNYSGRVMDACAGLGGIPIEAAKLGMPSINNELNPQRMATALQRMSKVIKKEPVRL